LVQPAFEFESVIVAVPLPETAELIVTVLAKLAVSVSVGLALNVQGLATPEQVPPDQLARRLPELAAGVIVIESPTSARQLVTLEQPASELPSVIFAVPLPVTAAVIVTVLAKLAVSVSVLEAVNVQGLVVPEQVPPDQPVKRLPEFADSLIEIESPTNAVQCDWLWQLTRLSVTLALPLPLTEAVIVTLEAAMCATGPGPLPSAVATSDGAGGLRKVAGAEVPALEAEWCTVTSGAVALAGAAGSEWARCAGVGAIARGEPTRWCELGGSACVIGAATDGDRWPAAGTRATL
jgi:hypothetical protein